MGGSCVHFLSLNELPPSVIGDFTMIDVCVCVRIPTLIATNDVFLIPIPQNIINQGQDEVKIMMLLAHAWTLYSETTCVFPSYHFLPFNNVHH